MTEHLAQALGARSRAAVERRDREAWLALWADDAVVEDPIGVSPLDPEGHGHRGKEAIGRFWDEVIMDPREPPSTITPSIRWAASARAWVR